MWDQATSGKAKRVAGLPDAARCMLAQGAGVGGGSLIYANVHIEAPRELFDLGSPAESPGPIWSPFYATRRADDAAASRVPENQVPERLKSFGRRHALSGFETRFRPLRSPSRFDDEWRYGREQPFDAHALTEMDQRARQRAGHVCPLRQLLFGCPVGRGIRST